MMERIANYIDGELVAPQSSLYIENINPAEGKVYSFIPDSDNRDVQQAVQAATAAFKGWSETSADKRCAILLKIADLVEAHVRRVAPAGVEVEFIRMHGGRPWRARLEGRLVEAGAKALEKAYGKPVVYAGEGGSIPIVPEFERVLGAPALLMGFGLPGENAHAPDEWMSLDNYEKGTHAAAALLTEFAEG